MKAEAQRVAIAEACGWKFHDGEPPVRVERGQVTGGKKWIPPDGSWLYPWHRTREAANEFAFHQMKPRLPDYLNSLDAMHEAEKVLDSGQRLRFGEALHAILKLDHELDDDTQLSGWSVFDTAHATAPQRAESLLRAIGKWEEGV